MIVRKFVNTIIKSFFFFSFSLQDGKGKTPLGANVIQLFVVVTVENKLERLSTTNTLERMSLFEPFKPSLIFGKAYLRVEHISLSSAPLK